MLTADAMSTVRHLSVVWTHLRPLELLLLAHCGHTAPATKQAPIRDAGTAISEVGALLHWETVDLGEGGGGEKEMKKDCMEVGGG